MDFHRNGCGCCGGRSGGGYFFAPAAAGVPAVFWKL
jgi:hypothetical protein